MHAAKDESAERYDIRSIANVMIEEWRSLGAWPTSARLNRLLYMFECRHIARHGTPALHGWFEAWERGPVQPTVAMEFEAYGLNPVDRIAMCRPPFEEPRLPAPCFDVELLNEAGALVRSHHETPQWTLDAMCCARGGAWHAIVEYAKQGHCVLGMRIPHESMGRLAGRLMLPLGKRPAHWRPMPDRQFGDN